MAQAWQLLKDDIVNYQRAQNAQSQPSHGKARLTNGGHQAHEYDVNSSPHPCRQDAPQPRNSSQLERRLNHHP